MFVGLIIGRIAGKNFDEMKLFLSLDYSALREMLVHNFKEPKTVQLSLQDLAWSLKTAKRESLPI